MASPDKGRFRFSILQKVTLGFGLATLLMLLRSLLAYHNASEFLTTASLLGHSHRLLEANATLRGDLMEAESAGRGYMIEGDGDLSDYFTAADAVSRDLERLKTLTADDSAMQDQLNYVKGITPMVQRKLEVVKQNIEAREAGGAAPDMAAGRQNEGKDLMADIRKEMMVFESAEEARLAANDRLFEQKGKTAIEMVGYGTVLGVLFLALGLWMILRDIRTGRRVEAELDEERNLLSVLIETIPHQVYVKDVEGRYVMDNIAHRKYLGVGDVAEVNGTRSSDYFPPEIARIDEEFDERVMKMEDHMFDHEEPGADRKGNLLWLSTTKIPLYDTAGKVVGLLALSEDITERKHAEERLHHYAEQMERSNKELEEFASIASHDLQEPLRKIMAFGHRLQTTCGEALGEQGNDYVDRMRSAAERMQTLIHDLLTLSRVTSMARPFKKVDLIQVVKEVVSDLELQIERTGGFVEVDYLPEIEADPVQMRQLFQNLLSNALKFHRPGENPHVSICAKVVEMKDYQLSGVLPGDDACRIMVKDNGIGFSKEYSEKIFALFQRLHGRKEYEGTGIGLAVCRKITDRHGGSIVAKSEEGEGATFIVTLPVKQNTNDDHEYQNNANHHPDGR